MQLIFVIIIGFAFELDDCASLIEYVVQMVLNANALIVQILFERTCFSKPKILCVFVGKVLVKILSIYNRMHAFVFF
jgi:hypothetical protein